MTVIKWLFHKCRFGKVEADGYQYCQECGKAQPAPRKYCQHKWETISSELEAHDSSNLMFKKGRVVMRCVHCGEITQRDIL